MVSRRDFIGSVIATVAVSGLPFKALRGPSFQPYDPDDPLCKPARIIELMRAPLDRQMASRILLRLSDGEIIRGPEILRIEQPASKNPLTFIAQNLEMSRALTVRSMILINDKNQLITEGEFDGGSQYFAGPAECLAAWHAADPAKRSKKPPTGGDTLIGRMSLNLNLT